GQTSAAMMPRSHGSTNGCAMPVSWIAELSRAMRGGTRLLRQLNLYARPKFSVCVRNLTSKLSMTGSVPAVRTMVNDAEPKSAYRYSARASQWREREVSKPPPRIQPTFVVEFATLAGDKPISAQVWLAHIELTS